MAYSTRIDIENKIGAPTLLELTDPENTGEVDDAKVTAAITDADAVIDSYCAGRYSVPFNPVPAIIKKHSVSIAVYFLFEGTNKSLEALSTERKSYEDAIKYLDSVSRGVVTLGAATVPPASEIEGAGPMAAEIPASDFMTKLDRFHKD